MKFFIVLAFTVLGVRTLPIPAIDEEKDNPWCSQADCDPNQKKQVCGFDAGLSHYKSFSSFCAMMIVNCYEDKNYLPNPSKKCAPMLVKTEESKLGLRNLEEDAQPVVPLVPLKETAVQEDSQQQSSPKEKPDDNAEGGNVAEEDSSNKNVPQENSEDKKSTQEVPAQGTSQRKTIIRIKIPQDKISPNEDGDDENPVDEETDKDESKDSAEEEDKKCESDLDLKSHESGQQPNVGPLFLLKAIWDWYLVKARQVAEFNSKYWQNL